MPQSPPKERDVKPPKTARQTPSNDYPMRIEPLNSDELTGDALELAMQVRKNFNLAENGTIPAVVATMLRHPDFYRPRVEFTRQRMAAKQLELRDMEIAILRTARRCNSEFSWGEHVPMAKRAGITSAEIERLTADGVAEGWNERDGAIVRAVDELHDDSMVSDATWAALAEHFTPPQLIELISLIGIYHENSFLYNSLRAYLIPGNSGLASR
jgi:alkylhydroperoxidase family enzyme